MNSLRFAALLAASLLVALPSRAQDSHQRPRRAWLFCDLGNTVVQTWPDPHSNDVSRAHWIRFLARDGRLVTAYDHLFRLGARGHRLGLIANMPPAWGDPDLAAARAWSTAHEPRGRSLRAHVLTRVKMATMLDFLEGRGPDDPAAGVSRWRDRVSPRLIHQLFPDAACLVPFLAQHRKPDKGPASGPDAQYLFREAAARAAAADLVPVYLGENPHETAAARQAGLKTFTARFDRTALVQGVDFLPSVEQLEELLNDTAERPWAVRSRDPERHRVAERRSASSRVIRP